jgi:hypothetical protein
MSPNDDEKLDAILRSRRTEAPRPDLVARIVFKAQGIAQVENASFWQSLRQVFVDLHLPKPAYVLAATLILGIVLGFSTAPSNDSTADTYSASAQSFLDDEGLL